MNTRTDCARLKVAALLAFLFLVASVNLAAEGRRESPRQIRVIALKGPTGLGMLQLLDERRPVGGVSVEYSALGSPDLAVARLVTGEADFAALPTNLAANLYNRGMDFRLAAVIGNGVLYLVSSDPSVTGLRDLSGRTVNNVAKGSTPEFVVRHLLEKTGVTATLAYRYPIIELAQAMAAGRESLGILPEPFVTKVLRANPQARIAVDLQAEWRKHEGENQDFPMSVLVVGGVFAKNHPRLVSDFLRQYRESQDWVRANPAAAGRLAEAQGFGMSAVEAEAAIPRSNLVFGTAVAERPRVERLLAVFLRLAPESVGGRLPDADFYAAF